MPNKYNPFRPDKAFPPGLYVGRLEELTYTEHCLHQARYGNSKHYILEGERGIGKTSMLLYDYYVASGQLNTLNDQRLNFITLNVSLQDNDTWYTILKKISKELRAELANRAKFKTMALQAIDILSRIEAGGIRYSRDSSGIDENELLSNLLSDMVRIIRSCDDETHGICLLIDEADKPPASANLGLMCKLMTEELTRRGADKLCIGLAGLPGIVGRLRDSHESATRLFHVLSLKPLSDEERKQVIDSCLEEAKTKNNFNVSMTEEAKDALANLSEGYPHFLQEFGYCAYEEDTDNVIDRSDVSTSLFREHGAFDQLGRKYFDQYYAASGSEDYRKVLIGMSDHLDGWVDRATIIRDSGVGQNNVDNALRALKGRNIILQNEKQRGQYRLPTKSFAVWLRVRKKAEQLAAKQAAEPPLFLEGQ